VTGAIQLSQQDRLEDTKKSGKAVPHTRRADIKRLVHQQARRKNVVCNGNVGGRALGQKPATADESEGEGSANRDKWEQQHSRRRYNQPYSRKMEEGGCERERDSWALTPPRNSRHVVEHHRQTNINAPPGKETGPAGGVPGGGENRKPPCSPVRRQGFT